MSTCWRLAVGKCNFSFKMFTIAKKQSSNATLPGHHRAGGESRDAAGGAWTAGGPSRRLEARRPPEVGLARPSGEAIAAGPQRDLLPLRSEPVSVPRSCASLGASLRAARWEVRGADSRGGQALSLYVPHCRNSLCRLELGPTRRIPEMAKVRKAAASGRHGSCSAVPEDIPVFSLSLLSLLTDFFSGSLKPAYPQARADANRRGTGIM